jgi:hypothetical protein
MVSTLQGKRLGTVPNTDEHLRALQRLQAKQSIIADLISGRLDLLEATARFQAVQQAGTLTPATTPDAEDGEAWCRTVLGWAHLALSDCPERAEALSVVWQCRLNEHLSRFGGVRLPNPRTANHE